MSAVCEVCGTGSAARALLLCRNFSDRHPIGCHTYCLSTQPDQQHTRLGYTCSSCLPAARQGRQLRAAAGVQADDGSCGAHEQAAAQHATGESALEPKTQPGPSPAAIWSALPTELLPAILQHVPWQERLTSCALVSTAWAAAAVAATSTVSIIRSTVQSLQTALDLCAARCGPQLTAVQLRCHDRGAVLDLQQLPCAQLRDLGLCYVAVRWPGDARGLMAGSGTQLQSPPGSDSGNGPNSIAEPLLGATALTRLSLQDIKLYGDTPQQPASLAQLTGTMKAIAALPSLQHLCVMTTNGMGPAGFWDVWASTLLPRLHTSVTCLQLGCDVLSTWDMQCLGRMTWLQRLELRTFVGSSHLQDPLCLAHLTRLTQLDLYAQTCSGSVMSGWGIPDLCSLTALQTLQLSWCAFDATRVAALTQLRCISLSYLFFGMSGAARGFAALLNWLQQQQQLTSLTIVGGIEHHERYAAYNYAPVLPYAPSAAAYAGLTAGGNLRQLHLSELRLPCEAWQHLLSAGGQLQQLTGLTWVVAARESPCPPQLHLLLQQGCPALQELQLLHAGCGRSWLQLSGLLPLTHLTCLSFSGASSKLGEADTASLLQLTWLRHLELTEPSWVSDAGLQRLTGLRELTQLRACSRAFSRTMVHTFKAVMGTSCLPPALKLCCQSERDRPVWRQLLECCQHCFSWQEQLNAEAEREEERRKQEEAVYTKESRKLRHRKKSTYT